MQIALIKFDLKSDENITIDLGFISENIKTFQSVATKNDFCSSNFPTDIIYFRMRIDRDINAIIDLSSNSEFILYDFTVNNSGCPKTAISLMDLAIGLATQYQIFLLELTKVRTELWY